MKMKRIYTDERFPGVEVVNLGNTRFLVQEKGRTLDEFTSYESKQECVSEEYAQRRAADYFNRLALHETGLVSQVVDNLPPLPPDWESAPVASQIVGCLLEDWRSTSSVF